jgi:hypothetical protein
MPKRTGAPAPYPPPPDGVTTPEWLEGHAAHAWRVDAYNALHSGDPQHREYMAHRVRHILSSGEPAPAPAVEWLVFVLGELIASGAVPTRYRGRPTHVGLRAVRHLRVAEAVVRVMQDLPQATYDEINELVAEHLARESRFAMSASNVKRIRELPEFGRDVAIVLEHRDRTGRWVSEG